MIIFTRNSALIASLFIGTFHCFSQVYINKEWVQNSGSPEDLPWTATAVDNNRHLVVVGNTENAYGDQDVLIVKYDENGDVLWQQTYAGTSGENDYGVAVYISQNYDVLVAATVDNTSSGKDIAVLMYSSTGVLQWDEIWDGAGVADVLLILPWLMVIISMSAVQLGWMNIPRIMS